VAGLARNLSNEDEALGTWGAVLDPRVFLGNGKEGAPADFGRASFVSPGGADGATSQAALALMRLPRAHCPVGAAQQFSFWRRADFGTLGGLRQIELECASAVCRLGQV